jgi:hypothetical protein
MVLNKVPMASRDDVYLKFGVTAEAAQLLETSLGTALLGVQGLKGTKPVSFRKRRLFAFGLP